MRASALCLLLFAATAAMGEDLHAVELASCDAMGNPSATEQGFVLEFYNDECKWIDYESIRAVAGASAPDLGAMLPPSAGFDGKLGVKLTSFSDTSLSMAIWVNSKCSGMQVLTMQRTDVGQCGELATPVPDQADLSKVQVRRLGASWAKNPPRLNLPEPTSGNVQVKGIVLAMENDACDTKKRAADEAASNGALPAAANGACESTSFDTSGFGAMAAFVPDKFYVSATCYDGYARLHASVSSGCGSEIASVSNIPSVGIEMPYVDLEYGKCVQLFVKLHTYMPQDVKSLRLTVPVQVGLESCEFADGATTFAPPASALMPAATPSPPQNDDSDEGMPTWAVLLIVVGVLLVVGVAIALVLSKASRKQANDNQYQLHFANNGKASA